jgi:hypothetical protein
MSLELLKRRFLGNYEPEVAGALRRVLENSPATAEALERVFAGAADTMTPTEIKQIRERAAEEASARQAAHDARMARLQADCASKRQLRDELKQKFDEAEAAISYADSQVEYERALWASDRRELESIAVGATWFLKEQGLTSVGAFDERYCPNRTKAAA